MKEFQRKLAFILQPAHLGIYILLSAFVWSISYYNTRLISTRGSISVTGVAYENVQADLGTWTIQIEKTHKDRKASYNLLLVDEQKIRTFLKDNGSTGVGSSSYDTQPVYKKNAAGLGGETNEIESYRSTALFGMSTSEVDKIDDAHGRMHQFLIDQNITLTRNEVEYFYTKLEELKISLLEKAISNAKDRARAIGKQARASIGRIITASQGIFQINRAGDSSVSDYGNYDTSTIDKSVRALVTVEFESK